MAVDKVATPSRLKGLTRRDLLVGASAAVGASALTVLTAAADTQQAAVDALAAVGASTEPFYGTHQAGIRTGHQAHGVFNAYRLTDAANRETLAGVMRIATIEAARLCMGRPGLSDTDPTLAENPARLTITFGFGEQFFPTAGVLDKKPKGFVPIPGFPIDELTPEWSDGDLLIHIGADDPLTVAHAARHMTRVVSSVTVPHYSQRGFVRAQGTAPADETPRNLLGQKDGTENPRTDESFDSQVWAGTDTGWFSGGTQLVVRRIAMKLDTWDLLSDTDKSAAIGRTIAAGAPLTGVHEFDAPDFEARNSVGLTVIPEFAHIRRAHSSDPHQRFLRRPFNYDEGFHPDGTPNVGLIFTAYTTNIEERFIPVQRRVAEMDLLNVWTTPVGSSVFVIPPGCREGGYIGETLLS